MKFLVGNLGFGGFGAMMSLRRMIMSIADRYGRIPVFTYDGYLYEDPFLPLHGYKPNSEGAPTFHFERTDNPIEIFDFKGFWRNRNRLIEHHTWYEEGFGSYLMYAGYLYNKMYIKESYRIEINKEMERIEGIGEDMIGVHLRRGDKIKESPYVRDESIFYLIDSIGIKRVFLASDEDEYIQYIIQKYKGYEFIYDKEEKRYGSPTMSNIRLIKERPELKHQETITFLKNMEILKHCKYVIGSTTAQLAKIAGSMNSFIQQQNRLYLINPRTDELEHMGTDPISA